MFISSFEFTILFFVCYFSIKGLAQRPQLLVIQPQGIDSYVETSTDALSVRGFEEYLCNNYFLGKSTLDNKFPVGPIPTRMGKGVIYYKTLFCMKIPKY